MKKAISLILALSFMVAVLAGCGNTDTDYLPSSSSGTESTDTDIASLHKYEDDGNCTTPVFCSDCGELVIQAKEAHDYKAVLSYTFTDDNFLNGGTRIVKCSNLDGDGCLASIEEDVPSFAGALGYAVTEYEENGYTSATITSSFNFNMTAMKNYADYLSQEKQKQVKFEYGVIVYVDALVSFPPLRVNGSAANGVIKGSYLGASGVNDFSIPGIAPGSYDEDIILCGYFIFDDQIYYLQSNSLYTDYNDLVPVSVNKILNEIN